MKQITEEKFKAIQVLAEDFSTINPGVYASDGETSLSIKPARMEKGIKITAAQAGIAPLKKIEITYDIEAFKNLGYDDMARILKDMERGVTT